MTDFFDKLKKGMDIENPPSADFETKAIEEEPIPEEPVEEPAPEPEEPEAVLTSAVSAPEPMEEKPAKKKPAKRKPRKKKAAPPAKEKKAPAEKKIEVKQESSLEEEPIDGDIFQKEGQLTVDVFETENEIIIQSVVAGVDPEDLDISIEKDMVSIKGRRERKVTEHVENFFYQECFWGRFTREVVLPSEVDKNRAEASMKNGVLTIKIPKINTTNSKKLNISVDE